MPFAFADDLALTVCRSRSMQRIINTLDQHLQSIHLTLKPKKCKTLSICSGYAKDMSFSIGNHPMDNIITSPFKFLGGYISASGSSGPVSDILKETIIGSNTQHGIIMNVDASPVRGEYKCEMYRVYIQGAIRYLLTVHDVSRTQLHEISHSVTQYLKKWANMKKSSDPGIIYHSQGLGLSSVQQLYMQQHANVMATVLTSGDDSVRNALDAKVERESAFTRKSTGTMECFTIAEQSLTTLRDDDTHDQANSQQTKKKLCQAIKARLQKDNDSKIEEHSSTLKVQGRWTELVEIEQTDIRWRSSLYNAPRGVFEFALNGMTNWLPTRDNLVRWGKLLSTKCPLCQGHQTLRHVLNACPVALTARYTWRHNSVLKELVTTLQGWYSLSEPPVTIRIVIILSKGSA
ncbi:uncharacterized protein LOC118411108 [Branchiostoma floridae]|uniref:Uncharacterized protein LOC118411108 n=1 Tax=Branchiostoma floridae TaxID=7739 RepID=A0A9J7MJE3_BRAFL|nr:uncharacterized protein LOC118411108 [Branchiostoma floridae]